MENWTNLDMGREGGKNPGNFADIICTWPLTARIFFFGERPPPSHPRLDVIEASSLRFRLRQRHLHHRSPSVVVVLVQFVLYLSPPLLRKSLRFISRAMAASVHPMMMVCTPTSLATLCRGGFSQPHSIQSQGEEYSPTPPFCHARREGRMDPRDNFVWVVVGLSRWEERRTDGRIVLLFPRWMRVWRPQQPLQERRPMHGAPSRSLWPSWPSWSSLSPLPEVSFTVNE